MNTVQNLETQTTTLVARRRYFPAINWGAIIAGIVVGMATQLVLALLGVAAGLSAIDMNAPGAGTSPNAPVWAAVWQGVSMLIAAFVGGYVAARMSGLQRNGDGMLHGLVAWGATTLLVATLAASALGSMFGGMIPLVSQTATHAEGGAAGGGTRLEDLIRRELPQAGQGGQINSQTLSTLYARIRAGDRQGAIDMMQSMGISSERASAVVDQALALSGTPEAASPAGRARAEETVDTASSTSWWVFGAVALSMLLGIGGGIAGAAGSHRHRRDDHVAAV